MVQRHSSAADGPTRFYNQPHAFYFGIDLNARTVLPHILDHADQDEYFRRLVVVLRSRLGDFLTFGAALRTKPLRRSQLITPFFVTQFAWWTAQSSRRVKSVILQLTCRCA